jgi:hypothetical protein
MTSAVDSPSLGLGVDDLVDWLELTAIFSEFGVARIDAMVGALYQLEETAEDDIGQRDREREKLVEQLENEVELRRLSLRDAYPFSLNDAGEELIRVENWKQNQYAFYLVCLVTTHVTGSAILRLPPVDNQLTHLRNRIFQIVATLGLAGLSTGPALSVGWPRRTGETIVQLLTRAAGLGAGFAVRNPIGDHVAPHEKDGGIDVIGWTPEALPPPSVFYFAQAATGKNWTEKPVSDHADVFREAYTHDFMCGNRTYVTLIPRRVLDDRFRQAQHRFHKAILERLSLPLRALQGLRLASQGTEIDEADQINDLTRWLDDYINYALTA